MRVYMLGLSSLAVVTALIMPSGDPQAHCGRLDRIDVPGAEHQAASCLEDLTTRATTLTGHTVPGDWAGLTSVQTVNPSGVPGIQVDGYFPDTSTTNTHHGWDHDAQFVIRFPDRWNGKLVVTGAPGVRRQYALDAAISDWLLARGYAFAATDKGNTGTAFYRDGAQPGDAVAEWNTRVTELTVAAKEAIRQRYGRPAARTYVTGVSNGGYLTRWQLENHPQLYDGGVDWEGTLFRADGPNLLTFLPAALRHYPAYRAGSAAAHQAILDAGFPAGSEFLWDYHYAVYWDLTQRIYREEFDPSYDGETEAGTAFCPSGTPDCDADYDYASRPREVRDAVAKVELTGRIGKPLLTLHGTLDALLPPAVDSDVYAELVAEAGRRRLHRYYLVEDGNHVDGLYDVFPAQLRPILPCYRDAFAALEAWVEDGERPPASGLLPRPASGDLANSC
jgi:fermentation-respiration switch protein FrsA (DUF1100 family)